ncbi:receptor-like protein 9DC3 [Daucus carota subsp. sativus]|uniref:receptor-like protein 9DC3 n=1 Tax=Daucus carota subsp. sativus TaxID=79200 RepID=UPI0030839308
MNSNNIEGSVPLALANCTQLQILDFGNNKLKDTFPWWLVALPKLQILVLRSNRLHGNLSVGNVIKHPFPKLRIMDLSHNRFSGNLPINFFDNFKDMADSDQRIGVNTTIVGDSYYEASISLVVKGEDLEVKRILYIYTSIDLSSNKFTGGVPKVLGELKSLRLLNLSDNKLTGHIPSLLGSIPQGRQLDTMSNDSYLGNLALCGFPLTKKCRYDELPKPEVDDDNDDDWFDWKMMLMGYGSGLAGGLSMGYIVFTTGKPWRFVMFVEKAQQRLIRR